MYALTKVQPGPSPVQADVRIDQSQFRPLGGSWAEKNQMTDYYRAAVLNVMVLHLPSCCLDGVLSGVCVTYMKYRPIILLLYHARHNTPYNWNTFDMLQHDVLV